MRNAIPSHGQVAIAKTISVDSGQIRPLTRYHVSIYTPTSQIYSSFQNRGEGYLSGIVGGWEMRGKGKYKGKEKGMKWKGKYKGKEYPPCHPSDIGTAPVRVLLFLFQARKVPRI